MTQKPDMGLFSIFLLAVGLAADCFSVSVASGVLLRRARWGIFLKMAFFFGLFQAAMPLLGWWAASLFSDNIHALDHWIAFGLLGFIGGKMIFDGLRPEEEASFDPSRLSVVLALAVGTSIDALAVGITFSFMGYKTLQSLLLPTGIIGIVSLVASLAGSLLGALACRLLKFRMELAGGIVLVGLGLKILIEHLTEV